MTSTYPAHAEDLLFRLLKLLQDKPDMSQRDLAGVLGVSYGKMNYCLKDLRDRGLVTLENVSTSKHRWRYAYLLTPAGRTERALLTQRFLKRKRFELQALQAEIEALESEAGQLLPLASAPH